MAEVVHVSVWLLVVVAMALGVLGAIAYKSSVTPKAEAETLLGEAKTEVAKFDAGAYSTIKLLESEGKADVGLAASYLERSVGVVLKKL
jgi:hypothetical protein